MNDRSSMSVADFLRRSLAAGAALAVPELEVKARAAGLLGENQQIQHAKTFIKAKKDPCNASLVGGGRCHYEQLSLHSGPESKFR